MLKNNFRAALIILSLPLISLFRCSTGAYQDWYADEGKEEDLLGGLFSDAETTNDQSAQPVASGKWDNWYKEGAGTQAQQATATPVSHDTASALQSTAAQTTGAIAASKYTPEFSVSIIRENKSIVKNQITLFLKSSVHIPEIKDMGWRTLKKAQLNAIDGDDVQASSTIMSANAEGVIAATIAPAGKDELFSFIPLPRVGIKSSTFSLPHDLLSMHTASLRFTAPTNQSYEFQYNYQTFNRKSAAEAFATYIIAPHIRQIQVNIYDAETHFPISGAVVTLDGAAPSPLALLSPYFSDAGLLAHAAASAPKYAGPQNRFVSNDDGLLLPCYTPFKYKLGIVHPQYFFVEKEIVVDDSSTPLEFYLTRRPENVRLIEKESLTSQTAIE